MTCVDVVRDRELTLPSIYRNIMEGFSFKKREMDVTHPREGEACCIHMMQLTLGKGKPAVSLSFTKRGMMDMGTGMRA